MKEFKGTKGKWELQEYKYGELIGLKVVSNDSEGFEEIIFDTDTRGYIDDETEANAKLIAAAPEMLEMLRILTDVYSAENIEKAKELLTKILD